MNRKKGALVGAVVGDLIGATYEFRKPSEIPAKRLTVEGGGVFNFPPGVGTDDTDLLFASLAGYDHRGQWHPDNALTEMLAWLATGPRDVGNQTLSALSDWADGREPERDESAQGNGGLMRAAAHAIMGTSVKTAAANAADDTLLTHPSDVAAKTSYAMASTAYRTIQGQFHDRMDRGRAKFIPYPLYISKLSGHCVHTLRLAMTALHTAASFEEGIDAVVRTGGDTDTNAAVAGALLGAKFGLEGIPADWRAGISPELAAKIEAECNRLGIKEEEYADL